MRKVEYEKQYCGEGELYDNITSLKTFKHVQLKMIHVY